MAQHSNEHLTITELSAYLDKELAPEELALCDAHLQSCQFCQSALADLRLTAALLSSMPQVAVPRSFTLPTNLLVLPETPPATTLQAPKSARSSSRFPRLWRRTMGTMSTLVAILGLFFFLAGAISFISHGGAAVPASTSSSAGMSSAPQDRVTATASVLTANTPEQGSSPGVKATHQPASTAATTTPTQVSTHPAYNSTPVPIQPSPTSQLPAVLDLGQPGGRLSIGGSLLLLGILGTIITRLLNRSPGVVADRR